MTARCSFDTTPSAMLAPVPSIQAVAQGYQTDLLRTPIYAEHNSSWESSPIEQGIIGVDYLPHLRVTEHPIEHPPAGACFTGTGNYSTSPLPFPEHPAPDTMPPLPPQSSSSPSPSPSPHDHRTPRACHSVERRPRSRPSSRGGTDYFSKLTRAERAAVKNASSRRVTFAQQTHQIASSSLWSAPNGAPPTPTHTTTPKFKRRRPPTPSPMPAGHVADLGRARASFDYERDMSPGFDADVEFEPTEATWHHHRTHISAKERLTIIIPGGKSEAYVAMAFERSCSLANDNADKDDDARRTVHHGLSSSSSPSFIPPPSAERFLLSPEEGGKGKEKEKEIEKTGLKIKIPVPNPLFMLALQLAGSCHVSDEAAVAESASYPGTRTGFPGSGFSSPIGTSSSSSASASGSDNVMMVSQDRSQGPDQLPLFVRLDAGRTRTPSPEGRVARRVARRAALAPYCASDRLHIVPKRNTLPRPSLTY